MTSLSKQGRERFARVFTTLTAITTTLSLSGVAYLAPVAMAATPADYGLKEGDVVSAAGSDDPDVYIVNEMGFKRLFLNPAIFNFYGHLGGFAAVKNVSPATRDAFGTSGLFRNCETNDEKVYGVETTGEDVGMLHWVNTSGAQAVADDADFFKKVFCINSNEFNWYSKGSDYTSVNKVPSYVRGTTPTTPAPTGPLSVMLASDNPAGKTITLNASGVEMLKARFSGSGTVNTLTIRRAGAGETDDFNNIYVYDGATRLGSGKVFSTATGEVTFLVNVPVSGTKDLSFVAEMAAANNAGNVNAIQLKEVTLSGGATVSGLPVTGNNFTSSGASSGTVTVAKSGVLDNPTVGQKNALVSEFKYTTATEGGTVKRITMINGGNIKASDLTNVKLKTLDKEWAGSSTSNGYLVFDLGAGHFIAKGSNAIFKVYADIAGKKDETVDLYFEYDTDTNVIGDQYGNAMAVTDTALDSASDATTLTLQGGALTLVFNGPNAKTIATQVTDVTLLEYSMTAVSNIEVRKTELTLCSDAGNDGTYDDADDQTEWDALTDIKIWDTDINIVVMGPKDGTAFNDADDAGSCPNSQSGAQEIFTDVFDLAAGKTYNFKVTGDVDTSLGGTLIDADSVFKVVLDDYSDDAGDVTVMKYSGTNTSVAAADIVPRADISGNNITIAASSLTLSLAGTPASQTKVKGTDNVDVVGITFSAAQASDLRVTQLVLTGYAADKSTDTYDEGTPDADNDSGVSVANAMESVQLYESGGTLVAGSDKVTSNQLSSGGTGTITFSNLNWSIPAGTSKTLLVRANLSSNAVSGTNDTYAFDIAATGNVTALDNDSNTINAGNSGINGGLTPTRVLTVSGSGSLAMATSAGSPSKGAVYWGQTNAPISKFRLSATDEGQYIEKLTIAASDSTENTHAGANVKTVHLTYKNKAGDTLTKSQSMGSAASVNFNWSDTDANRPYVPQDANLELSVNADLRTKAEGATPTNASPGSPYFSLDIVDRFNGSFTNGFRAVGDGSGTVLTGDSSGVVDVVGANDQYVYRVYPEVAQVALASPYNLIGTPVVFKFSVTAKGVPGATLRFDNEANGSGSFKFEVQASGQWSQGGTSTSFTIFDENNTTIDSGALTGTADANPAKDASLTFNFTNADVEIAAGDTKTFSVQITNPGTNYAKASATGRAADYFQLTLVDDIAGNINWVADYNNATTAIDTASVIGTLRNLPLYGPTFQR